VYTIGGDILLLQRQAPFDFWQSVTGSLDEGETSRDAASRELFEETGFAAEGELIDRQQDRVFTIDPRWRSRYASGVVENTEYEWHYRLAGTGPVSLDDCEHSAYRWVPIDEAIDLVWSSTNKDALVALRRELRQKLQSV
jgi:dATP pyrophosphohydrolase